MKRLITTLLIGIAILAGAHSSAIATTTDEAPTSSYCVVPNNIQNGNPLDAAPVMANYNYNSSANNYGDWFQNDGVLYNPTFTFNSSSLNYTIPANVYILNGCRTYGATTTQTATASATNYVWLDPYGVWRYSTTNTAPTPNSVLEYTIVASGTGITSVTNPPYAMPNFLNGLYAPEVYGPASGNLLIRNGNSSGYIEFLDAAGLTNLLKLNNDKSGSLSNGTIAWTATGSLSAPSLSLTTPLGISSGGTGTSTPALVAGSNITLSGSWPAQTIATVVSPTFTNITASGLLNTNQVTAQSGNNLQLSSNQSAAGGAIVLNYNAGANNTGGLQIFEGGTVNYTGLKYNDGLPGVELYDGRIGQALFEDDGTSSYARAPSASGSVYIGNSNSTSAYGQINASGYTISSSTYGPTSASVNGNVDAIQKLQAGAAPNGQGTGGDIECARSSTTGCAIFMGGASDSHGVGYINYDLNSAGNFEFHSTGPAPNLYLGQAGSYVTGSSTYGATSATVNGNTTVNGTMTANSISNGSWLMFTGTSGAGAASTWIAATSNHGLQLNVPASTGYSITINGIAVEGIDSAGDFIIDPIGTAVSGTNYNSAQLRLSDSYWNGTSAISNYWSLNTAGSNNNLYFGYNGAAAAYIGTNGAYTVASSVYGPTSATVNGTATASTFTSNVASSTADAFLLNNNASGTTGIFTTNVNLSGVVGQALAIAQNGGSNLLMLDNSSNLGITGALKTGSSVYGPTSATVNGNLTFLNTGNGILGPGTSQLISDDGSGGHGWNLAASSGTTLGFRFYNGAPSAGNQIAQIDPNGNILAGSSGKGWAQFQTGSSYYGPTGASVNGTLTATNLSGTGFGVNSALCTDASKNITTICSGVFVAASTNNTWTGTNDYQNTLSIDPTGTATSSTNYQSNSFNIKDSVWNGTTAVTHAWTQFMPTGNSLSYQFDGATKASIGTDGSWNTGSSVYGPTNAVVNGQGTFISPNAGTSGGVVIRDAATNPNAAFLQFTNNAQSSQYGFIRGLSAGGLDLNGEVTVNSTGISSTAFFGGPFEAGPHATTGTPVFEKSGSNVVVGCDGTSTACPVMLYTNGTGTSPTFTVDSSGTVSNSGSFVSGINGSSSNGNQRYEWGTTTANCSDGVGSIFASTGTISTVADNVAFIGCGGNGKGLAIDNNGSLGVYGAIVAGSNLAVTNSTGQAIVINGGQAHPTQIGVDTGCVVAGVVGNLFAIGYDGVAYKDCFDQSGDFGMAGNLLVAGNMTAGTGLNLTGGTTYNSSGSNADCTICILMPNKDGAGYVTYIGTNSAVSIQGVNCNDLRIGNWNNSTNAEDFCINSSGNAGIRGNVTAANFFNGSKQEWKHDISNIDNWDALSMLPDIFKYKYNKGHGDPNEWKIGYMADGPFGANVWLSGTNHDHADALTLASFDDIALKQEAKRLRVLESEVKLLNARVATLEMQNRPSADCVQHSIWWYLLHPRTAVCN